jgi:hypothetical protein
VLGSEGSAPRCVRCCSCCLCAEDRGEDEAGEGDEDGGALLLSCSLVSLPALEVLLMLDVAERERESRAGLGNRFGQGSPVGMFDGAQAKERRS